MSPLPATYDEKMRYEQNLLLRQFDTDNEIQRLLQKRDSQQATEEEERLLDNKLAEFRARHIEHLRNKAPQDYTEADVDLTMAMMDTRLAELDRPGASISKVLPIESIEAGLNADYSKPFDRKTNRTLSITGSIGATELTEHLSPQQIDSNLGLNYPNSPYHAGADGSVRAPVVGRIDMLVTPEIRATAKVPLDPVLVEKIVDMQQNASSPEMKERARAFREAYATRISMIPRKDKLGADGQSYEISEASRRAMERMRGEPYSIEVGREDGQEPPYTGHSAPGSFDVSEFTVIGTELYVPSKSAISLTKGARISMLMAKEGETDPARMDRPAGERHRVAFVDDDGVLQQTADPGVRDWLQNKACDEHLQRRPQDEAVIAQRWRKEDARSSGEERGSRIVQEHVKQHPEATSAGIQATAQGRGTDVALAQASAADKEEREKKKQKLKKKQKQQQKRRQDQEQEERKEQEAQQEKEGQEKQGEQKSSPD
jgi:hypothetical protein